MMSRGHRNSFQAAVKVNIPSVAIAGFDSGRMIRQ